MNRRDGIAKSGSGEPLQAIPILPCLQGRARVESRDSGDRPMSMTHYHAAGMGDLYSKWHDKFSLVIGHDFFGKRP